MSQDEIIQGIREAFNSQKWSVSHLTGPARQLLCAIAPRDHDLRCRIPTSPGEAHDATACGKVLPP